MVSLGNKVNEELQRNINGKELEEKIHRFLHTQNHTYYFGSLRDFQG